MTGSCSGWDRSPEEEEEEEEHPRLLRISENNEHGSVSECPRAVLSGEEPAAASGSWRWASLLCAHRGRIGSGTSEPEGNRVGRAVRRSRTSGARFSPHSKRSSCPAAIQRCSCCCSGLRDNKSAVGRAPKARRCPCWGGWKGFNPRDITSSMGPVCRRGWMEGVSGLLEGMQAGMGARCSPPCADSPANSHDCMRGNGVNARGTRAELRVRALHSVPWVPGGPH